MGYSEHDDHKCVSTESKFAEKVCPHGFEHRWGECVKTTEKVCPRGFEFRVGDGFEHMWGECVKTTEKVCPRGVLLAFAFLAGATCGTFWCTVTPVLVEVVGLKKFAGTFSVVLVALVLPTTFAEVVAMEVAKASHGAQTRDYTGAQAFVGFMFLAGALSLLLLRCWKVWRVELDQQDRDERGQAASWGSRQWMPWLRPRFVFGLWRV